MRLVCAYLLLGLVFGIICDAVRLLELLLPFRAAVFILDIVMLCVFSVLYVCFIIALENGVIRWYNIILPFVSFSTYLLTIRRINEKFLTLLKSKCGKLKNSISKFLKFSKKY
ncbi:MAG: hypothetical protein K6C14_06470 [Eubacterium sp.]|nr:hypothetical protein [Eubacterium sp.]